MPDIASQFEQLDCEVHCDPLTRQLYATDASLYRVEPWGVAFPRNTQQAAQIIRAAADAHVAIIPRGAGSGLVGGAIGEGLVVEFARHNREIGPLDLEKRTIRVGPGVVLDGLNAFLRRHGLCFGPDVATSSRATIGGMIANNSSGARTPVYGTTADHVVSVELVLADGRVVSADDEQTVFRIENEQVSNLARQHAEVIRRGMPAGLLKRWPGYGLDRYLREPKLAHLLAGSEGTLAAITSAELSLVPLPAEKGLGLVFFASVADAMQATVELLELQPAALEHIDRVLTDQTKGQLQFRAARDLLELDAQPCESILLVEFYDNVQEKLAALDQKRLGLRRRTLRTVEEMNLVWALRKAGVALLTGCRGRAKPVTCIEDAAIPPRRLPEYVSALRGVLEPLGVEACFYGHAASGLLHVRPVLNLHSADDRKKFRQITGEVSALVKQFRGSIAAEHGVGMARTEFMREQLDPELLEVMREVKRVFDPRNVFNPGKIFDDGRYRLDTHLRVDAMAELELPFTPQLAFAGKDESFLANLEQCNGCGGCRKAAPTMCPTFIATGDELMSTRGRANVIRAALERRFDGDPLLSEELEAALSNCLSCKACTTECPSNVNMALLKAELLHARQERMGLNWRARLLSSVDLLGRLGTAAPRLANGLLKSRPARALLDQWFGITARRPLPLYTHERFDDWFHARPAAAKGIRQRVVLWDDCFVRYHEPQIGRAAVKVLESAGCEVVLARHRQCCGRPAFSQGNLDAARRSGAHNIRLLTRDHESLPVVFLEPSCYSMFAEDYRELHIEGSEAIARRSFLFEDFVDELLSGEAANLAFQPGTTRVAIHAHCHAKALTNTSGMVRLARRLPDGDVTMLNTGCCGMAGAFGALSSKYDLSVRVAAPLVAAIQAQSEGITVIASGTSCRQQIRHLTSAEPRHIAEVLAEVLRP